MNRHTPSRILSAALFAAILAGGAGPARAQAQMSGSGGAEGQAGAPSWTPGTPPHRPTQLQGTGQQPGWNGGPHASLGSPQNVGTTGSPRQASTAPTKLSPPAGEWTSPKPPPAPPQGQANKEQAGKGQAQPAEAQSESREMWMGQEHKPPTQSDETYRSRTLEIGAFTGGAAEVALQRASDPAVKAFARFETAAQGVVVDVLARGSTASPPTTDPAHAARLRQLAAAAPQQFDSMFVAQELAGHEEALHVQQEYLVGGATDPDLVHIAKLMQAMIREHLALLQGVQQQLREEQQSARR